MSISVSAVTRLKGAVELPADKSLAHRAAIFAALASGRSHISNYPDSADPQSTLACLRQLGVSITTTVAGRIAINGAGMHGLKAPASPLDCGNSGTTMRLMAGILAGMPFSSTLIGDASLSQRPMRRIADPLRAMGARITLTDGGPPIHIEPVNELKSITYRLPVPSAQVKSCVLLAGLWASGTTTVIESVLSRDHTELMLSLPVEQRQGVRHIFSDSSLQPAPADLELPGDFSAAAFFLVAGSIMRSGQISMAGVGLNSTRTGLLSALQAMGADISIANRRLVGGEPVGDLTVRPAPLCAVDIGGDQIPCLIDEIPVLAVAAACARGRTTIRNAEELRHKECDRIHATVHNLRLLGAQVEEFDDGMAVTGQTPLAGAEVDSFHDHRIAMAMGVAGLVASGKTVIGGSQIASVSFPGFWEVLSSLT